MSEEPEQHLGGGRSTAVVRIGNTVRREAGPWTPTIHAYLNHLRARGFRGAPEVLGFDERGREVLSYVGGETLGDAVDPRAPKAELAEIRPWPESFRTERALESAGQLLRALHEAAKDFRPDQPVWREYEFPMRDEEIVCHGDPGPWNVVCREGRFVAFIDWDGAHPDLALYELAAAAWNFVPLGPESHVRACGFAPPFAQGRRLRVLCDAYGLEDRSDFMGALSAVKQRSLYKLRYWQPLRPQGAAALLHGAAESLEWLAESANELQSKLS